MGWMLGSISEAIISNPTIEERVRWIDWKSSQIHNRRVIWLHKVATGLLLLWRTSKVFEWIIGKEVVWFRDQKNRRVSSNGREYENSNRYNAENGFRSQIGSLFSKKKSANFLNQESESRIWIWTLFFEFRTFLRRTRKALCFSSIPLKFKKWTNWVPNFGIKPQINVFGSMKKKLWVFKAGGNTLSR